VMENVLFFSASATAGPETSERLPWAQESLTVRTAAVSASGIEEDIFFLRSAAALVTLGFIEHAQAFHEQALSIQCGGLLRSFAFEVDLKSSEQTTRLKTQGLRMERSEEHTSERQSHHERGCSRTCRRKTRQR